MDQDNNKGLIVGLVVILLLAALFLLLGNSGTQEPTDNTVNEGEVQDAEQVTNRVNEVDLENTSGAERLPEGFPADTPVRTENILDSFSLTRENGAVESSVLYHTDASAEDIQDAYVSYLEGEGYEITESEVVDGEVRVSAESDTGSVSVSALPSPLDEVEGNEVFVSFVAG